MINKAENILPVHETRIRHIWNLNAYTTLVEQGNQYYFCPQFSPQFCLRTIKDAQRRF